MTTDSLQFTRVLQVTENVDVLVLGGGMAGISAAIAAARYGAKTMLVERHATLGGAGATCGVGAFCGETTGQGAVFDEVVERLTKLDAIAPYHPYEELEYRKFNHQVLPFVLQEMVSKWGVELLLHTWFAGVDYADGVAKHVVILGKSGLEAIRPKVTIDCTGEADVIRSAGLPTFKGRDSDHAQFPMALMFFMRDVGTKVQPILPDGCEELTDDTLPMTSPWPEPLDWAQASGQNATDEPSKVGIKMKVIGYDATTTRGLSAAEVFARRRMFSLIDYWQRAKFPNHAFDHVAAQIGIREGCRVVGEYVLTEKDVKEGRRFDDGVAQGIMYLDAMSPGTDKKVYIPDSSGSMLFQPPPYHIPFRSLRPKGTKNLLTAGRCLSADHLAMSSARVMTTCSMMGQAAGIAAAMCVEGRHDTAALDVQKLRQALLERTARL